VPGGVDYASPAATGGTPTPGGGSTPATKRQSQQWTVTDAGVTGNDGGAGITVLDINTVNSSFQGLGYTFPNDGASDDNSWTIDIALPTFMSTTPNMTIRVWVVATGTGAC